MGDSPRSRVELFTTYYHLLSFIVTSQNFRNELKPFKSQFLGQNFQRSVYANTIQRTRSKQVLEEHRVISKHVQE